MNTKAHCYCGHDQQAHMSPIPSPGVKHHACLWEGCSCAAYEAQGSREACPECMRVGHTSRCDACDKDIHLIGSQAPDLPPESSTPSQDKGEGEIGPSEATQEPTVPYRNSTPSTTSLEINLNMPNTEVTIKGGILRITVPS